MAKSFPMARGSASPLYLFLPMGLLLLALAACFAYFVVGPKRIAISDGSVSVRGSLYDTSVTRAQIVTDKVRIIDLDQETEMSPTSRTNGVDLLGYKEGWFRLRTGEKAFVVMSSSKVVYIPTTAGFAILFSPPDPEKLIASLR